MILTQKSRSVQLVLVVALSAWFIAPTMAADDSTSSARAAVAPAPLDVPGVIGAASAKYQPRFKLSEKQAVAQLDGMLLQQYAAGGSISGTKDAYLKSLYYQAATLLMNGYPIAGGTVVSIARIQPGFPKSPGGRGLAHFVDAMLAPDEEDGDMLQFQERASKAQVVLKAMRPDLRLVAQLRVMGEIYHDDLAVDAGNSGLKALNANAADRVLIDQALKAK